MTGSKETSQPEPPSDILLEKPKYIFVYGTLRVSYTRLPNSIRNMRPPQILNVASQWKGVAKLNGYQLYDVGSYPGVIPTPAKSKIPGVVCGDLFAVKDADLPFLDEYEGIAKIYEAPHEYRRIKAFVEKENSDGPPKQVLTWVYEYNWPIPPHGVFIPDGEYVDHCARRVRKV